MDRGNASGARFVGGIRSGASTLCPACGEGGEAFGEVLRRIVGEAAEHHVWHQGKLARHRLRDVGVVVAVARGPPTGGAIHQNPPILQINPAALGAHRPQRRGAPCRP